MTRVDLVEDDIGLSAVSYAACEAAFHDPALVPGIDPLLHRLGIGQLWGSPEHTLTDSEGPNHGRLRRVLTPWFSPRRVAELRARTASLVTSLLDDHDSASPFDVMTELADIVPSTVFCWMLGAPDADHPLIAAWSKALIMVFTATPAMVEPVRRAKAEIARYAANLLAEKGRQPDDQLAAVLAAGVDRGEISEADALGLLEELLSAAVDNTANTTGCALQALASHPDQWAALHADVSPAPLAVAVEECGRWQPAIRHTVKYAVADTSLAGVDVPAATFVTVRIAAAHRDPTVFPDPDTFDVGRPLPKPQLAFGAGRHHCLGASLARMEVQEMVGGVVGRFAGAEVADGAVMEIPENGHVYRLPLAVQ